MSDQTIPLTGKEKGSAYKAAIDAMEKAREKARSVGIKGLAGVIKEAVFDKFAEVYAVSFVGIIPYFNDGDSCNYGVDGPNAFKDPGLDDEEGCANNIFSNIYENDFSTWSAVGEAKVLGEAVNKALGEIPVDNELFQEMFGEHAKIVFTRKNVFVREYTEHD